MFNPNIPQATDLLEDSQAALLNNNTSLDTSFGIDHTTFSDLTANNGFHKQLTFFQVHADPAQAFPASMLYEKNSGVAPNRLTDLYFSSKMETGTDVVRQLTGNNTTSAANAGTAGGTIYTFTTPWGLTIYSGSTGAVTSGAGGSTVIFPTPFTTLYTALASANDSSALAVRVNATTAQLNLRASAAAAGVYWFAFGAL